MTQEENQKWKLGNLKGRYSAQELKEAGYTAQELKDAGFTAKEIRVTGSNVAELISIGFTKKALEAAGISARLIEMTEKNEPKSLDSNAVDGLRKKLDKLIKEEERKGTGSWFNLSKTRHENNKKVLVRAQRYVISNASQIEALLELEKWVGEVEERQQSSGMDLSEFKLPIESQEHKEHTEDPSEGGLTQDAQSEKELIQLKAMTMLLKEEKKSPKRLSSRRRKNTNIECLKMVASLQIEGDEETKEYNEFLDAVRDKQDQVGLDLKVSLGYLKSIGKLGKMIREIAQDMNDTKTDGQKQQDLDMQKKLYEEALKELRADLAQSIVGKNTTKGELFVYDQHEHEHNPSGTGVVVIKKNEDGGVSLYIRDEVGQGQKGKKGTYGRLIDANTGEESDFGLKSEPEIWYIEKDSDKNMDKFKTEAYIHTFVEHLGKPFEFLDSENFKQAISTGCIETLRVIGEAGISAKVGELNGDFKFDNVLWSAEKGFHVIDKDFEEDETPESLVTGMLLDGRFSMQMKNEDGGESNKRLNELTSSSTAAQAYKEMVKNRVKISEEESLNRGFLQHQYAVQEDIAEMVEKLSTEIKEQYGKDYLSEGLTKMAEILGKDQVVHDSWAFCTMGRMMAKRAMTEVPGDIGAQHLESACIEMQEKMLTALAEKMKSCNKGDKETVNKVLTELSKDFSPDTVRQSVIDRAKDLKRQHTEKCEKILDLYQKLHKDIDGGEHNLESLTDKQRHDVAEIINRHFEPGSVEESNLKSVEKTTIERDTLRSAKQEVEAYIERESGSTGPPENKRDTNEKDENLFTKL